MFVDTRTETHRPKPFGIDDAVLDFIFDFVSVVCMVILACFALRDIIVETTGRKGKDEEAGAGLEGAEDGSGDVPSYDEVQKLSPVPIVRLEKDFLVPKAYLQRTKRKLVWLNGAIVLLSLSAVLAFASWWWVAAVSLLYLVVVVATLYFQSLRRERVETHTVRPGHRYTKGAIERGKEDDRRGAGWMSRSEGRSRGDSTTGPTGDGNRGRRPWFGRGR